MQKKESTMGNVKDLFIQYMPRVRILYLEEAEKKLSTVEKEELYDLRNLLFESIKRYGFSLVHERIGKRGNRNDHKDVITETEGVLFIAFCENLGKYNTAFLRLHILNGGFMEEFLNTLQKKQGYHNYE